MRDISKINGRINIRPSAIHPRAYARGIPRNKLNKEQLTDTLNKKGKDENLLDELEDEIKTGIGDVLFPQKALVPISIKESAEER